MINTCQTSNPFTGEVIATYHYNNLEEINVKISKVKQSFKKWRLLTVKQRVAILQQAITYFDINSQVIAREISQQMGKPLKQAEGEVAGFFERANYLLSIAEESLAPQTLPKKEGLHRRIEHSPLGTVLILAAWNYPLMIAVNGVLTALLAGNTVILKHALSTLSIGEHFEKAFGSIAGYEDLVQHIVADHDTLATVTRESAIDHVVFTGSVKGGHAVYANTASRFIDCHLELGGKDGAYVAADADPIKAAEGLVDGAMYNAGQSCCGIERVYVHEKNYDAFIEKCREVISTYRLGDPMDANTDMGPLFNARAASLMVEHVKDAKEKGAELLCGGQEKTIKGATFFEPTLLAGVTHNMEVMKEENFGPIMPVMKVKSDDQAIELINDCKYGLTSAIFTNDDELAEKFAFEAQTGTVFRNRCDYLDPALPWTGVKDSGKGSGLSNFAFYGLTRRKSINFRQKL